MKFQENVSARGRVKPQIALSCFAFDLRVEHLDRGLIHLQVAGGLQFLPNALINGQQEKGDLLQPLHHLLAGNDDPMSLAKIRSRV